jgi:hypothetical protein
MPGRASVIKGRRLGTRSKLAEITVRSERPTLLGNADAETIHALP